MALKILVCHTLVNIDFANLNLFLVLISKFSFCSIIVWLFERDVYVRLIFSEVQTMIFYF